jgi:hypothetical protein
MSASRWRSTKNPGKGHGSPTKYRLPLILVGGGILLIALAAVYVFATNQPPQANVPVEISGAPSLKVDRERVDFGDVKVDTPVSVSFEIANVGDQPLRFNKPPTVEVVEGC